MSKATASATGGTYQVLPVARIRRNPEQPRQLFDETALQELAASIAASGLLQPLVVRPVDTDDWILVAGERRWRALQMAGITEAPCRLLDSMDEEEAFVLSVAENVARRDMTLMEEARAFQRMVNAGRTLDQVGKLFGRPGDQIQWRIDLLRLRPDAQQLVERGQIGAKLGWWLSELSPIGQQAVLAKWGKGEFRDDHEATAFAKAVGQKERNVQDGFWPDPHTEEEKAELRQRRRKTLSSLERLDTAGAVLDEIGRTPPAELAQAIQGEVGPWADRLDELFRVMQKARKAMRDAVAIAKVMGVE